MSGVRVDSSAGFTETYAPAAGSPDANAADLAQKAVAALATNDTFVAAAKPATASAQASQAYDQAVRLTRENSALIRLLLGLLDTTAGT